MSTLANFRPRRSCLYMPGANSRALEKATTLAADMLILDLEDAVATEVKQDARDLVATTVASKPYGAREVVIRINGLDTPWGEADLNMAATAGADGIAVPKVVSAQQVHEIDSALSQLGASTDLKLWVMVEMPLAILNIQEIAACITTTRLYGFVLGTNDLAKEMLATPTPDREAFKVAMNLTLMAARAYGLVAIDGVYNDFKNEPGFIAECEQSQILGFDGKSLIHPNQLAGANQVFSPDAAEVEQAREVMAAFELPENQGKGVISVNGKMVELLHLQQAQRLVSIADAIVT